MFVRTVSRSIIIIVYNLPYQFFKNKKKDFVYLFGVCA